MVDARATTPRKSSRPRIGRKRRLAGWVLLAFGVLVAAMWGASAKWHLSYVWSKGSLDVYDGTVDFYARETEWFAAGFVVRPSTEWNWRVPGDVAQRVTGQTGVAKWWIAYAHEVRYNNQVDYACIIPWPFAAGFLAVGTGLWCWGFLARRSALLAGHCPNCRYNLAGLPPGTPCPECGHGGIAVAAK